MPAIRLSGQLADFDGPVLLTLMELAESSGSLRVDSPSGTCLLFFDKGAVVYAEALPRGDRETVDGDLAAFHVLGWQEGEFRLSRPDSTPANNVERSNQALCLDAMRLLDESRNGKPCFVATGTLPEAPSAAEKRVTEALSARPSTLAALATTCGMSPLTAYWHLEQLENFGAVTRREVEGAPGLVPVASSAEIIRVLVVDDSPLMQRAIRRILEADQMIEVVGTAKNGREALELLSTLKPDVVSLDLFMPVMDGVTTLKRIMLTAPVPTVIMTSANPEDLDRTFESILQLGAIDFITKPARSRGSMETQAANIRHRFRKAAAVSLRGIRMMFRPPKPPAKLGALRQECQAAVVAVGGTGGCLSLMQLVTCLDPGLQVAVLGVLAFPEEFLKGLATYLDKWSAFDVVLAEEGRPIQAGVCYLASIAEPPRIRRSGDLALFVPGHRHIQGATPTLMDVAAAFEDRAIGLLLSGEAGDTPAGLAAVRAAGGIALAQLPTSCLDPEQSHEAIDQGLIDRVVLLPNLTSDLSQILAGRIASRL